MKALLGLLLLSVLLTSGYCLKCETCVSPGTSCSGTEVSCPSGLNACFSGVMEVSSGTAKLSTAVKSCFAKNECQNLKTGSTTSIAGTTGTLVSVECSKAPVSSGSIFLALSSLLFLKLVW